MTDEFDPMDPSGTGRREEERRALRQEVKADGPASNIVRDQLKAFVERIERLEEEKKVIADDIKDIYGEAKAMGYDSKIMRRVIALRKKDPQERVEEQAVLETYLIALGMLADE